MRGPARGDVTAPLSRSEIADLARQKFGAPNARLSRGDEQRHGTHGSKVVDLATGAWFDHERGEGGVLRPPRELPTPQELWDQAHPLVRGSLGWRYWVDTRCCCITPGLDLREHGALWYDANRKEVPGLVAAVRDARGAFIAIHRTFLDPRGAKFDRKAWGPIGGGHIVIHDPGAHAAPGHLLVGEGLESTSSAAAERPECLAWSALSVGGVSGLALPAVGVTHLTIAPDMDAAGTGQRAAAVLARRASDRGIAVEIIRPPRGFNDMNDLHRERRPPEDPSPDAAEPARRAAYAETTARIAEAERRRWPRSKSP
jgi:hypothetical protein